MFTKLESQSLWLAPKEKSLKYIITQSMIQFIMRANKKKLTNMNFRP